MLNIVEVVIPNGETESEEIDIRSAIAARENTFCFVSPDHGVIVNLHFATLPGGTFYPLKDGYGNAYALEAEAAQILAGVKFGAFKLVANGPVTGDQTFEVSW